MDEPNAITTATIVARRSVGTVLTIAKMKACEVKNCERIEAVE
jgi:hypothetical protein